MIALALPTLAPKQRPVAVPIAFVHSLLPYMKLRPFITSRLLLYSTCDWTRSFRMSAILCTLIRPTPTQVVFFFFFFFLREQRFIISSSHLFFFVFNSSSIAGQEKGEKVFFSILHYEGIYIILAHEIKRVSRRWLGPKWTMTGRQTEWKHERKKRVQTNDINERKIKAKANSKSKNTKSTM